MSDKKIVAFAVLTLSGTAFYQLSSKEHNEVAAHSAPAPMSAASSVAVTECVDCVESIYDSCDITADACLDSQDCSEWLQCTEECINLQLDEECYFDCDVAHSDTHSECTSMKNCMCDVCTGQCVDMCSADG